MSTSSKVNSRDGVAAVCRPGIVPAWDVREVESRREYEGKFVLVGRHGEILAHVQGLVVHWPGLPVDVYVHDPPEALRRHRHGSCLQLLKPDARWFKLHWEKPAQTFDQARAYVEQLLAESMVDPAQS